MNGREDTRKKKVDISCPQVTEQLRGAGKGEKAGSWLCTPRLPATWFS